MGVLLAIGTLFLMIMGIHYYGDFVDPVWTNIILKYGDRSIQNILFTILFILGFIVVLFVTGGIGTLLICIAQGKFD